MNISHVALIFTTSSEDSCLLNASFILIGNAPWKILTALKINHKVKAREKLWKKVTLHAGTPVFQGSCLGLRGGGYLWYMY